MCSLDSVYVSVTETLQSRKLNYKESIFDRVSEMYSTLHVIYIFERILITKVYLFHDLRKNHS